MPYGGISYSQSPQLDSPLQHSTALVPAHMGTSNNVYTTGSESNGSPSGGGAGSVSSALQTTSQSALTTSLFRNDDKRLTREAMEKYLRNRNDMIIVILHAKVITYMLLLSCQLIELYASTSNAKVSHHNVIFIVYLYLFIHFLSIKNSLFHNCSNSHNFYTYIFLRIFLSQKAS